MERYRSNDRVVTGYRKRATVDCHLACAKWLDKLSSVLSCLALLILTAAMWVRNDYPLFQSRTRLLETWSLRWGGRAVTQPVVNRNEVHSTALGCTGCHVVQHPHGSHDSKKRMSSGRLGYLQGFMQPLFRSRPSPLSAQREVWRA